MASLIAREGRLPDWDGPVVDITEDGKRVGYVYIDGGQLFAEFVSSVDGEAWAFEVEDLQRVLDVAAVMLDPGTDTEPVAVEEGAPHPVDHMATVFDPQAMRRGDEDEGFYPLGVALTMVRAAAELDLAVVSLEGFTVNEGWIAPVAGCDVDLGLAHDGEAWPIFKAGCNVQAEAVLEKWPRKAGFGVAVELADSSGERYVM